MKKDEVVYESLDRVKMDTGRRSALFRRDTESTELKGIFGKLKISEDLSATLPLISYLGITYKKNEVVKDVLNWFEDAIYFLNYGNPYQELRTAIAKSEDIKHLVLNMIKEMDLDIEDFRIEEKDNDRIEIFNKAYCRWI